MNQQWEKYYQCTDADERKKILETLKNDRLSALYEKRYAVKKGKTIDLFMYSWIMINGLQTNLNRMFFKKRDQDEFMDYVRTLGITEDIDDALYQEWVHCLSIYFKTCLKSKGYNKKLFGIDHLSDEETASKIAAEINLVTISVPKLYDFEYKMTPFRKAAIEAYCKSVPDGEEMWKKYGGD